MDPEEGQAVEGAQGDDGVDEGPARDMSDDAIAARMAELGYDDDANPPADDDGEPAPKPAAKRAKPAAAKADGEVADEVAEGEEKPAAEKAPTTEEGKSWQAKMKAEGEKAKAEISTLHQRVQKADARDKEWMAAANETLLELKGANEEIAGLRALLKQAGIEEDPRSAELRQLRVELERTKGGQTLQQQLVKQGIQAQALAAAQQVSTATTREAQALIGKHAELGEPGVAEELLTLWAAAAALAEKGNKKPPSMTAFVEKQLAALRFEKQRPKIDAKRAQLQRGRKAPHTLNGTGSSGVPAKFPSTDEGIKAWAKAKGYE